MDNLLKFFQKIELTAVPSILKKNLSAKKNSKVKLNPNTPDLLPLLKRGRIPRKKCPTVLYSAIRILVLLKRAVNFLLNH